MKRGNHKGNDISGRESNQNFVMTMFFTMKGMKDRPVLPSL